MRDASQTDPYRATKPEHAYRYTNRPFRWFWDLIRPVRGRYFFAQTIDLLSVFLTLVPATIVGLLVDEVLRDGQVDKLPRYVILLIAVPFVRSLMGLLLRYNFEVCSQDSVQRIREGLYRHLQELDAAFYHRSQTGDIMAKMTGDIDMVRHFVAYTAFASIDSFVLFIIGTIYLMTINWQLALTALAISPLLFYLTFRLGKTIRPVWFDIRAAFSRLNSVVQQNIAGNRVVRAFVRSAFEEEKFETENNNYRNANLTHNKVFVRFWPFLDGIANFMIIPVILVGGLMVIREKMTLGDLVIFNGLLFVITGPMRSAGNLMNEIQRFSTSAQKLIDLLMEKSRIQSPVADTSDPDMAAPKASENRLDLKGDVAFRHVSFNYGSSRMLRDINLHAKPGQTIGIIGLTGSGKTTLVNLIPRLYDPTHGTVLIDGQDVRTLPLQKLRRSIGFVMQDVFLFSDTIEGNIAYGDPDLPMDRVVTAATIASADQFIRETVDGYDTIIGERGMGLSGGQRQRIALARALAIRPRILILDDTTSAVDMETEQEIQRALRQNLKETTVFIIAHRISSVRNAHEIIVLDRGEIIERGTHDQLIDRRGYYFDVFLLQAGLTAEEYAAEEQSHGA